MKKHLLQLSLLVFLLGACAVPKDITYFQGIDELTAKQQELMNQTYDTKICCDDQLVINVSSWDPDVTGPFNPPAFGYFERGEKEKGRAQTTFFFTYLVDKDGYINFPVLGRVLLKGLSPSEASQKMEELIRPSAPGALVNVHITNFMVSILGEVYRPGSYPVTTQRISLLDLISQAGDLTINARRENVLLIRDNDGEKEYVRLDLTDPMIFTSPYFYLKQNDMVYVEPNDAKKRNSNYSYNQQYVLTVVSTIVSVASSITYLIIALLPKQEK